MNAETLWKLLGGPSWLCPLNATTYRRLVRRALLREDVSALLANYRTHWELALDCNLPGDVREEHKVLAINYGCALGNRLDHLLGDSPVPSPVFF